MGTESELPLNLPTPPHTCAPCSGGEAHSLRNSSGVSTGRGPVAGPVAGPVGIDPEAVEVDGGGAERGGWSSTWCEQVWVHLTPSASPHPP